MAEGFTVNGVTFPTDGFCDVLNLYVLWSGPKTKGSNRDVPHVAGSTPYLRRVAEKTVQVELVVHGFNDHTGAPNADPRVGLETNVAYIRANVTDPTGTGAGTRTLTLTLPSGATKSAAVQFEDFELTGGDYGPYSSGAVVDITIPAGELT